ncbi:SGNH hydrolase [Marasmius fiardii PR-910]|nr:SGNH hydrolase [Marasmius fiardii PR-910]
MLLRLFVISVSLSALALTEATPPSSFVLIGDSTTAKDGGWGDGFCGTSAITSVLAPGTPCNNTARSGATTGSFVADGSWDISIDAIKRETAKGRKAYVTLQFGHNDQKIAPPESMGANLTAMVQELRVLGAEPILVTSLTRRNFHSDGSIDDILGPWANETILVSQGTHLLDLHATSIRYCEAIGPDASHRLNLSPSDNTHLNVDGAIVFARMVADLMNSSFPRVLPIVPDPELSRNISLGIPSF